MTPGFWLIVAMLIVAAIAAASLVGPLADEIRSIMRLRREAADLATELDNERNDHERTREALAQVSAALAVTLAALFLRPHRRQIDWRNARIEDLENELRHHQRGNHPAGRGPGRAG